MSQCNEYLEVDYEDPLKREPDETWSLRCSKDDDDHKLHESRILWLTSPPPDPRRAERRDGTLAK